MLDVLTAVTSLASLGQLDFFEIEVYKTSVGQQSPWSFEASTYRGLDASVLTTLRALMRIGREIEVYK